MKFEELVLIADLVIGLITTAWAVLAMAAIPVRMRRWCKQLCATQPSGLNCAARKRRRSLLIWKTA
jgi:hypothetical protein